MGGGAMAAIVDSVLRCRLGLPSKMYSACAAVYV